MDRVARGHGTRDRGASGIVGRGDRAGGRAGDRADRGQGRGLPVDSGESATPSVATALVAGPVEGDAVWALVRTWESGRVQLRVLFQHRVMMTWWPRAAVGGILPYLEMMGQMQRIGSLFFEGGVGPEEADAWRQGLELNFWLIKCPLENQISQLSEWGRTFVVVGH
ncbi:unnamed protein product [Microthlaspi erraticum]|uniref:Uncharacterized protein n=1 Tax=Microthlaspi erraticum TaxID=1685480 RepID=A0A6D2JF97_9BRAS|nr:unnamed protein product [Microthlaspi erraticum]